MKFVRIHPIMSADIAKEGIKACARPNIYWVEGGGVAAVVAVGKSGEVRWGPVFVSLTFNGVLAGMAVIAFHNKLCWFIQ